MLSFFFGSNALPISLNILSYPFTQQSKKKLHTFSLEPSILCILTSGLNHYATIVDIKHCFLLVYVTDAGAATDVRRRRRQQRDHDPRALKRQARGSGQEACLFPAGPQWARSCRAGPGPTCCYRRMSEYIPICFLDFWRMVAMQYTNSYPNSYPFVS